MIRKSDIEKQGNYNSDSDENTKIVFEKEKLDYDNF